MFFPPVFPFINSNRDSDNDQQQYSVNNLASLFLKFIETISISFLHSSLSQHTALQKHQNNNIIRKHRGKKQQKY